MPVNYEYNTITEVPGLMASGEQLERLYQRYRFALDYARNGDVLEVACGSGIGLGYLTQTARSVVGGDIDEKNLTIAQEIYGLNASNRSGTEKKVDIVCLDAHNLQFPDGSFDLVLLYEALYYLSNPVQFIAESARVLRADGTLIICMVNKDWADFHPSLYSHSYYSVPELHALIRGTFKHVELYGAFPTRVSGKLGHSVSLIKRLANRLHLIPGSLKARVYLKRLFLGPLVPLPEKISGGMCIYAPPVPIAADVVNTDYKIIYAVGKR